VLAGAPHLSDLAGRIAESVAGAYLSTIGGLGLAHHPPRADAPEVDFIMTIGTQRIPLEVRYRRRVDVFADTEGVRTFIEKTVNHAPFAVLVSQGDETTSADPRIVSMPLSTLLLLR